MKWLYFHQHFSTPAGATGIRSYEFARALIAAGHEVTMVCGSYNVANTGLTAPFINGMRRGDVDGIDVIEFELTYANNHNFFQRSATFAKFALRSIKVVFREEYDAVFCTSTPLTAALPGLFAKWFRRKPFVFEVRDLWPELPKAMGVITNPVILKGMDVLETLAYRNADRLVGLSPGMVEGITRKLTKNTPVAMIPNGCDRELSDVEPVPADQSCFDANTFNAVFAGAHGRANGLDAVLDTADVLQQRGDNRVAIYLIGAGREKQALQEQAQKRALKNVHFVDPLPKKALFAQLRHADVGLMTLQNIKEFYFGTSPNKFFDYLALGLPVVCNYPGWVSELIKERDCGLPVTPEDANAFADALIDLSKRSSLHVQSQNCKDLAKDSFDRNDLAQQFVEFIDGAVAS